MKAVEMVFKNEKNCCYSFLSSSEKTVWQQFLSERINKQTVLGLPHGNPKKTGVMMAPPPPHPFVILRDSIHKSSCAQQQNWQCERFACSLQKDVNDKTHRT